MPRQLDGNPNLWSPGIKYGVRPGSTTHLTEFFGPMLGVMRFERLRDAVALVNQTGYGLTSGLESLDEREWDYWIDNLHAGNLYLNRVTTGAVVLRQPFGGFGKSAFGPGLKAGSPNYVAQLLSFTDAVPPQPDGLPTRATLAELAGGLQARAAELGADGERQSARIQAAFLSYERNQAQEFGKQHDHFQLVGQDNVRRYLPAGEVRIRVHPEDSPFDLFARVGAAHTAGNHVTVSAPPGHADTPLKLLEELTESWAGAIEFVDEDDEHLAQAICARQADVVRYAAPDRVPLAVLQASAETAIPVISRPVLGEGRVELLWYLREQSLSIDYHRYGNLGPRARESRAEPL